MILKVIISKCLCFPARIDKLTNLVVCANITYSVYARQFYFDLFCTFLCVYPYEYFHMIFNNLENEETKCNMHNSENKNQFANYVNNMLLTIWSRSIK